MRFRRRPEVALWDTNLSYVRPIGGQNVDAVERVREDVLECVESSAAMMFQSDASSLVGVVLLDTSRGNTEERVQVEALLVKHYG